MMVIHQGMLIQAKDYSVMLTVVYSSSPTFIWVMYIHVYKPLHTLNFLSGVILLLHMPYLSFSLSRMFSWCIHVKWAYQLELSKLPSSSVINAFSTNANINLKLCKHLCSCLTLAELLTNKWSLFLPYHFGHRVLLCLKTDSCNPKSAVVNITFKIWFIRGWKKQPILSSIIYWLVFSGFHC